ncbi:MAG: RNA polymerase sigma factor [Candidatus Cloacimonetes bacterium]|nr:RNA polymerase sigma factor [Candidatus Cloacimonadota bacterium]
MNFLKKKYRRTTDEKLIALIIKNNPSAFNELYNRYSKRILNYFYRMLNDEEKAQDFLQDIFLKIIKSSCKFDGKRKFSAWIFTIANNMCKNEYRRMTNFQKFQKKINIRQEIRKEINQDHQIQNFYFMRRLSECLSEISEQKRSTFLLRFQEGFSIKEIAEIMGCPVGTVKSRLFQIVKELSKKLSDSNLSFEDTNYSRLL